MPPQLPQAIGYVAGATAILLAQTGYEKRYAERLHVVSENMLIEVIFKDSDGVKSDGSADQDILRHGIPLLIFLSDGSEKSYYAKVRLREKRLYLKAIHVEAFQRKRQADLTLARGWKRF